MNLALTNPKKYELKKHINAIHCSNNLSLLQRKLFNALLFNAYSDLPYKQTFQIKGKDLCSLIGYNSKDSTKLKTALLGLITIAIEWNVIDCITGQEKKWKASSILASAELSDGLCVYEYSQVMKDLLYQPEIYGRINIELLSKFKSSYGLALYENCLRYQGLPQTPWFTLQVFRKLMGVLDEKYAAFKDFKKRVVDIAVSEVNSISPITIIPEIERVNQKVTKIRFKLIQGHLVKNVEDEIILPDELNEVLTKTFGLSQQLVFEISSKYDQEYINEKIQVIVKSDNFIAGKIRGLAGYLIEALKKDYKPSNSSKVIVEEGRRIKEAQNKEKELKEENRTKRYAVYFAKKINEFIAKLTSEEHQILHDEFQIHVKNQNSIFQQWYRKKGLEHPAVKSSFNTFIKENRKEQFVDILTFEDFIELVEENNK